MTHTEELALEEDIQTLEVPGGNNSDEIEAFVRESQKILEKLIEDNKNLRHELKTEKSLRVQASHKIVESSASMLEEASEIAGKYIEQAKDQAQEITSDADEYSSVTRTEADAYSNEIRTDADAYSETVRKEADEYRKSIVNEVETERDLIALEVEELHASHAETKERIISFHQSILNDLRAVESDQKSDG